MEGQLAWLIREFGFTAPSCGLVLLAVPFPSSLPGSNDITAIRVDMGTAPIGARAGSRDRTAEPTSDNLEGAPDLCRRLPREITTAWSRSTSD